MKIEKLKAGIGKIRATVGKLMNTVGKLTAGFVVINIVIGVGALIGMLVVGETGNAKTFFSYEGTLIAALFNIALAVIAGVSFKDEQTKLGKIITILAEVNLAAGMIPLIGTCVVGESENIKIFYSCAGMFGVTSFDSLLAIMAGMSIDIPE